MYSQIDYLTKYDNVKPLTIQIKTVEFDTRILYTNHEIILILDGKSNIKINEKIYELGKYNVINVTPWTILEFSRIEKPISFITLSYNRMFLSKIINTIYSKDLKIFSNLDDYEIICLCSKVGIKAKKILLEISKELGDESIIELEEKDKDKYTSLFVITKIIEFLIVISRDIKEEFQVPAFSLGQSIIKYIFAHCSERLTINKLSLIFYMSESSVRKYIEDFSGLSFNDLLYKIRLQKSEELLLYTNMNLDEIAEISGFSDGSHINKVWNMKKNISPSSFRQEFQQDFNTYNEYDRKVAFEIINYILENYMTDLNVESTAKKFNISEIKLNKLLLIYVDRNFSTYLNYVRINKACEFLKKTNDSIIDICFKVGYNNIKTFNNNFSKYKNMTPSEFKNTNKI